MAGGSAVCQDKWVEPEKKRNGWGVGNGNHSCVIFNAPVEIENMASFLPVGFPPQLDPPPWGLSQCCLLVAPATMESLGE